MNVVILGCGRSGTSIFGELFEHIPTYTYHSEPFFDDLSRLSYSQPVAIKVPRESERFESTPGLSIPLDAMQVDVPDPKCFYWQVRHPLDAVASLKVGIADNWGHHPRPPDWMDWQHGSLVERCAHHWSYINSVGYEQVKDLARVCRFEDMIENPSSFTARICAEVGLSEAARDPGVTAWCERVQDTNNDKFVEAKTSRGYSRQDHSRRVGRWLENLGADELGQIVPIVRAGARTFGYELPDV